MGKLALGEGRPCVDLNLRPQFDLSAHEAERVPCRSRFPMRFRFARDSGRGGGRCANTTAPPQRREFLRQVVVTLVPFGENGR